MSVNHYIYKWYRSPAYLKTYPRSSTLYTAIQYLSVCQEYKQQLDSGVPLVIDPPCGTVCHQLCVTTAYHRIH